MTVVAKIDMAEMPVQTPGAPQTPAEARARFFNSGNAFNIKRPAVPAAIFDCPALAGFPPQTTGLTPCDQSAALGSRAPSTTPLMLARYATIEPGAPLTVTLNASDIIWYVISGSGRFVIDDATIAFGAGDVIAAPGGTPATLTAQGDGAVLWLVSNEPLLTFGHFTPKTGDEAAIEIVHYTAAEIIAQLQRVVDASQNATTSGMALIFSSARHEAARNIAPMLTLSLNTVPAGEHQRAHRHNSAAITLALSGGCYSMVGEKRCDWAPFATLVTPPTEPHSHHNPTGERAMFLIVQDGGLHYHARTMGFEFLEPVQA